MRYLAVIFLAGIFLFSAASFSATLADVSQLARAGAPQLALAELASSSPPSRQQHPSQWLSWQSLRISLLAQLNSSAAVLARVKILPANAPATFLRPTDWAAARAALALHQGTLARRYLARLLWQTGVPSDARYRMVRRLIIQSYVGDGQLGDAYRAMLRFQQDFSLDPSTTAAFVQALSAGGQSADALTWLARLDDASPLALSVKLKTGMISPAQAVTVARGALGRTLSVAVSRHKSAPQQKLSLPDVVAYWRLIRVAATMQQNETLGTRADEQLLNLNIGVAHATATRLWRAYLAQAKTSSTLFAQGAAAVLASAAKSVTGQPLVARSLFAALAIGAKEKAVRQQAITALVAALATARLSGTALQLFSDPTYFHQPIVIPPAARYRLGEIAQVRGDATMAAYYWKGLSALPAGETAESWSLKRAEVFMAAGDYAAVAVAAVGAINHNLTKTEPWLTLARRLTAVGKTGLAVRVLRRLAVIGRVTQRRAALRTLGTVAAALGDYRQAAAADLQSAMLAPQLDDNARQSRRRAAEHLAQAGFIADARAQYARLLAATRDAADRQALRQRINDLPRD